MVSIAIDVTSGEIEYYKENRARKKLAISVIPFSVASSKSIYCLFLSWLEQVFFKITSFCCKLCVYNKCSTHF